MKSVNKLISATFDINSESVSATVNQLAVRLIRLPLIAHLSFFHGASGKNRRIVLLKFYFSTIYAVKLFNRYSPDWCL